MKDKKLVAKALLDWIRSSKTEFIEASDVNDELKDIANKRGLSLPSPDFAIFKTIYAELDAPNRNGVRLRKQSVEAGLPSIIGKQINFDHEGSGHICGWILDGRLEENLIVIYGVFFKSMFQDEFEVVKRKFEKGQLFVSFEIHKYNKEGDLVVKQLSDGTVEIEEVHFAGCGLLIDESPACPKAEVLKLLANRRLLLVPKKKEHKRELIYAELAIDSAENTNEGRNDRMSQEIEKTETTQEEIKVETSETTEQATVEQTEEAKTVTTTEENIVTVQTTDVQDTKAEEMVEVKGEVKTEVIDDAGVTTTVVEKVDNSVTYTYEYVQAKEAELAQAHAEVEALKASIEELQTKLAVQVYTEEDVKKAIEEAKEYATKITARRIAIGDATNEVAEDILADDTKFENLQLKKELEQLKTVKASHQDLVVAGSVEDSKVEDKSVLIRKVIDELAWKRK